MLEEPAIFAIDARANDVAARAITPVLDLARTEDPRRAMERWMRGISLSWRAQLTRTVPGAPQQPLDDAEAFFADASAVYNWTFDRDRVAALPMPMLDVLSADADGLTRRVMAEFVDLVPTTDVVEMPETTHMLHTDQPGRVADALAAFFGAIG